MLVDTRERRLVWLDELPAASNTKDQERAWTSLWKMKVPSKLTVFLWRLARQSLPTADVLQHRNMAPQSACVVCGETDSWRHSLIECHHARSVWGLAPVEISDYVQQLYEPHARGWLQAMMKDLSHEESTRVVITLWALWHARRKIIHEGQFQSPFSTHCFIERFKAELQIAEPVPRSLPAGSISGPKWLPPPPGHVKVNVDAAVSKNFPAAAISAVARDEGGQFLGASVVVLQGVSDPESLEAMACREGLALSADLLVQRIRVASDCLNVIRSIAGEGKGLYGHVVQELWARRSGFQVCQFVHEGRRSNGDAHCLARGSVSRALGRHVWFTGPPEGLRSNILADCNEPVITEQRVSDALFSLPGYRRGLEGF
jgi:ribonuclease HI